MYVYAVAKDARPARMFAGATSACLTNSHYEVANANVSLASTTDGPTIAMSVAMDSFGLTIDAKIAVSATVNSVSSPENATRANRTSQRQATVTVSAKGS